MRSYPGVMTLEPGLVERLVLKQIGSVPFSGVVLVEQDGERWFGRAFGHANRADEIPNTMNTRFAQASGSKTFTAVAVARLVETGSFAFETRMVECLDSWPSGFDSSVTVHHLLTHTSGIPDYFDEEEEDDFEGLWTDTPMYSIRQPSDLLHLFADLPMKFAPGERFSYCNSGFVILGLLIEQHAGVAFSDYIEAEVLARAGMDDSGYFTLDRLPSRTAFNYLTGEDPDTPRINMYTVPIGGQPDGGAFVTAPDMTLFWSALGDHRLLSAASTEKLLSPHVATGRGQEAYGYGVWIDRGSQKPMVHHAEGGDPGVNFISSTLFEDRLSITVISNTDGGVGSLYRAITEAMVGS